MGDVRVPSVAPVHELKALQAFVHPLRSRLLGLLRAKGPATATELAREVGESTGTTSYHLRQLARFGFIEDDPTHSTGRARRWRALTEMTRTPAASFLRQPGGAAALEQVVRNQVNDLMQAYAAFIGNDGQWDPAWFESAISTDVTLRLTSDQLRSLKKDLEDVIWRYRAIGGADGDSVIVYVGAVPIEPDPP